MSETTNNTNKTNKSKGGRRKHIPPLKKRLVSMTDEQAALLRKWGRGDVSAGLRWLVDSASALILRKSELDRLVPPHNNE